MVVTDLIAFRMLELSLSSETKKDQLHTVVGYKFLSSFLIHFILCILRILLLRCDAQLSVELAAVSLCNPCISRLRSDYVLYLKMETPSRRNLTYNGNSALSHQYANPLFILAIVTKTLTS